jgi:DUF1680 family protein
MQPIDIRNVRLGGEIGRRIDMTARNNFLALDLDRDFLAPFRERVTQGEQFGPAGVFYVGLGKCIDAAARLAAYTRDPAVTAAKDYLVRETLKTQDEDGYIGVMPPDARIDQLWDLHEMGYLICGLVSDWRFCGEDASLTAAQRLAEYYLARWPGDRQWQASGHDIIDLPVLGVDTALLALYEATGEGRYLAFVRDIRRLAERDTPIKLGRCGMIEGHAYAYLAICVAQLRLHALTGDVRLLRQTDRALDFMLRGDGMAISGAVGDHECWHDSQEGTSGLGETCAAAYTVRWLDELLQSRGGSLYGDLMERVIYNTLFGGQSPDGRRLRYYVPFDGPRPYFSADTYCCPNNFRRIIPELAGMVFYGTDGGGLAVNLYAPAEARVTVGDGVGMSIAMETDYPRSGRVLLRVEPQQAVRFALSLRIPRWCQGATVAVNGEAPRAAAGGAYFGLERTWRAGDTVSLEMPMPVRAVRGRQAQAGRVACMRGPLVYGLDPEAAGQPAVVDPRSLRVDPGSVDWTGDTVTVRAWGKGRDSALGDADLAFALAEFPDPGIRGVYFRAHDPRHPAIVEDELLAARVEEQPAHAGRAEGHPNGR